MELYVARVIGVISDGVEIMLGVEEIGSGRDGGDVASEGSGRDDAPKSDAVLNIPHRRRCGRGDDVPHLHIGVIVE